MSFLHPEVFYYLLPPLVILFGLLLTQQESQADFFSKDVMDKLRVSENTLTTKARNGLFFTMAILIIIALSDPVINDGEVEVKAKSSDIMIAMDISDSMLAQDVYPDRLRFAKQKALTMLRKSVDERLGVVAFAKNSYLVSPLSFDHSAVEFLLSKLNTNSITEKGTNFLNLLEVVAKSSKNQKHLFILTDGGDKTDFSKEIEFSKQNNIVIFILGIGTKKGAPIKLENGQFVKQNGNIIVSKLNTNISKLATKTGGVYIEGVNSDKDIKVMISEIKAKIKAKELKKEKIKKYTPLFYYPLGLALLILLIATSSLRKFTTTSAVIVVLLSLSQTEVKAGAFDFMELEKAKKAYEKKDYKEASNIYEKYAKQTDNGESYFNAGNAFYKENNYKQAVKSYKKATFHSKELRAKNYANMGNAYARLGKQDDLQQAIKSYENSLKIQEDKEIRENLQNVKKVLKKQQKKKQQQNNKNNKNNKNQDKKQKNQKQNKNKNNKNQDKQQKKQDKQDKKQKNKNKNKNKNNQSKNNSKNNKKKDNKKDKNKKSLKNQKSKMSDLEMDKWMKKLNKTKNSYMYKLNKSKQDNYDEKPW